MKKWTEMTIDEKIFYLLEQVAQQDQLIRNLTTTMNNIITYLQEEAQLIKIDTVPNKRKYKA